METIELHDRVSILGKNAKGKVAFIGKTHFSDGTWFGVVLDEAKGRHNGTVDGTRYFKCQRNHGVFVRACQIEKENADIKCIKPYSSSKPTYPNYLKDNIKQKTEKYLGTSKNSTDMRKTKTFVKDECQQMKDCKIMDTTNESLTLKALKEENEELKNKLRMTEKYVQEISEKYNKSQEDINFLKDDIECKKKQIKDQKLNLKILKMRECKYLQKIDSFGLINKEINENDNSQSFDESEDTENDELSNLSDEIDLGDRKASMCMQHISILEEQNKIMIGGLIELRNLLKSKCRPHLKNLDISQIKNDCQIKNKNSETSSFSEMSGSDMGTDKAITIKEPVPQMEKNSKSLDELRKFDGTIKNKISANEGEIEKVNSNIEPLYGDISMQEKNITSDSNANKSSAFLQHDSSQLTSNENRMVRSDIQNHSKACQNSSVAEKKEFQSCIQSINEQYSPQLPKLKTKLKRMHFIRNKVPMNSDPVDELRHLMSKMVPNSNVESYDSDTTLIEQVEKTPDSSTEKSKSFPELCKCVPSYIKEVAAKASGDHAMALPIWKTFPKKVLCNTGGVCQTQNVEIMHSEHL